MRKCFLLLMATVCLCVNAQEKGVENDSPLSKGNITIGGHVMFDYDKEDTYVSESLYSGSKNETLQFLVNPEIGYLVADRFELGAGVPIMFMRALPRGSFDGANQFSAGLSPYAKYYFENNLFLKLSAGAQFGVLKFKDYEDIKIQNFEISPSVGYSIFINSKIAIEPSVSYRFAKLTEKRDVDTYSYTSSTNKEEVKIYTENSGIMFNVGFHLFL